MELAQIALALCIEAWPNCFVAYAPRRKPLKVGIHNDVLALTGGAIEAPVLAAALRYYTNNLHYQGALTQPGAERIDLNGKPVGSVTDAERAHARERFAVLLAKSRQRAREKSGRRMPVVAAGALASTQQQPRRSQTARDSPLRDKDIATTPARCAG
jgi:sRNA-binding protein